MNNSLKVGDYVKCINAEFEPGLKNGAHYYVTAVNGDLVLVSQTPGGPDHYDNNGALGSFHWRFEFVKSAERWVKHAPADKGAYKIWTTARLAYDGYDLNAPGYQNKPWRDLQLSVSTPQSAETKRPGGGVNRRVKLLLNHKEKCA